MDVNLEEKVACAPPAPGMDVNLEEKVGHTKIKTAQIKQIVANVEEKAEEKAETLVDNELDAFSFTESGDELVGQISLQDLNTGTASVATCYGEIFPAFRRYPFEILKDSTANVRNDFNIPTVRSIQFQQKWLEKLNSSPQVISFGTKRMFLDVFDDSQIPVGVIIFATAGISNGSFLYFDLEEFQMLLGEGSTIIHKGVKLLLTLQKEKCLKDLNVDIKSTS